MISRFLNYVELKTKITSGLTFFLVLFFLLYQGNELNWGLTLLFFFGMFFFDLTTTAINNYIDSKDNGQVLGFSRKKALFIIYVLFFVSCCLGLILAALTDVVVLLVGGLCFVCGIFYTYGPLPISRMPLGEVISGVFYGVMIPFILLYINLPSGTFFTYSISLETISLSLSVMPFVMLILLAIIPFSLTANIMLANNVCDLEKDIEVKRHTLPYYIGKRKSLSLFAALYYSTYVAVVLLVLLGYLSPIGLFALLTIIPVRKNIKGFQQQQDKQTTFNLSIMNFVIIMCADIAVIVLSILIRAFI